MSGRIRLHADRDACVGSGNCVLADDRVFDQGDDGLVLLVEEDPTTDDADLRRAVQSCPSGALRLIEDPPSG